MSNENTVYELLENAKTAEKVLDSIKVNNFWTKEYMSDNVIINGDTAEYYSSNPAAGTKYKSPRKKGGMEWDDDKLYKCAVPVLIDRVFQCKITKDMLRIATGDANRAEMLAALQANNLRKKLDLEIMDECVGAVCKQSNFAKEAYVEMNEVDFNDPGKFLKQIFTLAEMMKHPTDKYNKGYKMKNGSFEPAIYSSEGLKKMIVVLNTNKKTDLRIEGSKTYNYSLVDLKNEFKEVYDALLPANWGALIMCEESFAMNWQIEPKLIIQDHENDPLTKKVSLPGFVVGGPISFANMAAVVCKKGTTTSTPPPKKSITDDYAELKDSKSATMTKDQGNEWNSFGLNFERTKEWLDAGFLVSDAKFVNWMINTKTKENNKFKDYSDPDWCLNNLGQKGHKKVEDLRKEAGIL